MAGPPVEVQVRVNTGGSVAGSVFNWKMISPGIVTWPVGGMNITQSVAIVILKKLKTLTVIPPYGVYSNIQPDRAAHCWFTNLSWHISRICHYLLFQNA